MNPKQTVSPNDPEDITSQRLMDLEIKASFAEDLLDHLNKIVSEQQQRIDILIDVVAQLSRDRNAANPDGGGVIGQATDELPPHY